MEVEGSEEEMETDERVVEGFVLDGRLETWLVLWVELD